MDDFDDKSFLLVIVSCIGFVFSFAWYFVNKGSKQWQENWENHVELLEDEVIGPLYKTLAIRGNNVRFFDAAFKNGRVQFKGVIGWVGDAVVEPGGYSVSKINQMVSLFVILVWFLLLAKSMQPICWEGCNIAWDKLFAYLGTFLICIGILKSSKSHHDSHNPRVFLRVSKVSNQNHPKD